MHLKNNFHKIRFLIKLSLLFFLIGGFFLGGSNKVVAFDYGGLPSSIGKPSLDVTDAGNIWSNMRNLAWKMENYVEEKAWIKTGSKAFHHALTAALNTIAFDTATWLGSGREGQEPMFIREGWGAYLSNVGDNAAGEFIETLGREGPVAFNLCQPSPGVVGDIGMGLVESQRPQEPECTFSQMRDNWQQALDSPDFLSDFQNMFHPSSSGLGVALSLQTGMLNREREEEMGARLDREENEGWLDIRNIAGERENIPGLADDRVATARDLQTGNFAEYTGNAFVDASNIFLNQLLISAFSKAMSSIGKDKPTYTSPYSGEYGGLSSYESEGGRASGGLSDSQKKIGKLVQPNFNERGEYEILGELTICPNPEDAGPTECVLDDNFRRAISEQLTVGEAMDQGYLNPNATFGFRSSNSLEPKYNEGYPYRSMIILRKYRILPVGWELAAQYIRDNFENIGGSKNLKQMVHCYSQDDEYDEYYRQWCRGLVDPDWVLKAPANYCAKEGPGPEIMSEQVTGEGENSKYHINRKDTYCADEQSCIQEENDSCKYYGYCTEEQREWKFEAGECDAKYNTCQTYRTPEGGTISYLRNTLDYSYCNSDNVGCAAYSTGEGASYELIGDSVSWADSKDWMYFDRDAESCQPDKEGCHQFMRTKPGAETNLLVNPSFEEDLSLGGWDEFGATTMDSFYGEQALQLDTTLNKIIDLGPDGYLKKGKAYTFSFRAKNCQDGDKFQIYGQGGPDPLSSGSDWNYYSTTRVYPEDETDNKLILEIDSTSCIVDGIKLERGREASNFAGYGANGNIYERMLPNYLEALCYRDPGSDYRYRGDAPDICYDFARKCNESEVGCIFYEATRHDFSTIAKTTVQDRCPQECIGFDTYRQRETRLDSARDSYFIPDTAAICDAGAVGCDEFTNLDEVEQGGEAVEYYSYLRQCVKPSGPSQCAEYYTWEGSEEEGRQLVYFTLQQDTEDMDNDGVAREPAVISDDREECNKYIYELPPSDPDHNPDCRKFYNQEGDISYHSYSKTITCTEDCHPYRRTQLNVDPALASVSECSVSGSGYDNTGEDQFHWDSNNRTCYFCKGNGYWSDQHQACIYNAVPDQSIRCSASQAGCREYTGNQGYNTRIVETYGFESGDEGWTGGEVSQTAVVADDHSWKMEEDTSSVTVGEEVEEGSSYALRFLARSRGGQVNLDIYLANGQDRSHFSSVTVTGSDWRIYEADLSELEHEVFPSEELVIEKTSKDAVYIDNIRLTEVLGRYYLIKDSWTTPNSCNQDIHGDPYPLYMLGCEEYRDQDGNPHYLHDFDEVCQDSATNCELMIDTHNSDPPDSNIARGVFTPADNYIYMTYDADKKCTSADEGCQKLGKLYTYNREQLYIDTYLKNDPDTYDRALCLEGAVGCQEWVTEQGNTNSYFKDPGNNTCEWRKEEGDWDWYQTQVKRCDRDNDGRVDGEDDLCLGQSDCSTGEECESDSDCDSAGECRNGACYAKCIQEDAFKSCPTEKDLDTFPKTLGEGGVRINQPERDWAGLCPVSQSGCTEYIDSDSRFSPNLFDPRYDHPSAKLSPYTTYVDEGNNLGGSDIVQPPGIDGDVKYYFGDTSRSVTGGSNDKLRRAIVDYRIQPEIDKSSCSEYNYDEGCVWFNEREPIGNGSYAECGTKDGITCVNELLKVQPDRSCAEWLACTTYIKDEEGDNICFDVGRCNRLDDNGNCDNFIVGERQEELTKDYYLDHPDLSGYSKVGYSNSTSYHKVPNDLYNLGTMDQVGQVTDVSNGDFEFYGSNGYPIGWIPYGEINWSSDFFSVVNNPVTAQNEGIDYPNNGRAFLKYSAENNNRSPYSEDILVNGGSEYILSAQVNTINLKEKSGDPAGAKITIEGANKTLTTPKTKKWHTVLKKFTARQDKLNLHLASYGSEPLGNIYIDNIKITPALEVNDNWDTRQTCRLYPKANSLSCQYLEPSGARQEGRLGYCLEYDRSPGDSDACLLWWPVDMVKGQGIEEGAGYQDKFPLYYVTDTKISEEEGRAGSLTMDTNPYEESFVSVDSLSFTSSLVESYFADKMNFIKDIEGNSLDFVLNEDNNYSICYKSGGDDEGMTDFNECWSQWLSKEDNCRDGGTWKHGRVWGIKVRTNKDQFKGVELYSCDTSGDCCDSTEVDGFTVNYEIPYASKVVQTVTPAGQNKYWSNRVKEGSDYVILCDLVSSESAIDSCRYPTWQSPFGSMEIPLSEGSEDWSILSNPYEWDFNEDAEGNQPVFPATKEKEKAFRAVHEKESLKRIFAQSYGIWEWDGSHYVRQKGEGWQPPKDICSGERKMTSPPLENSFKVQKGDDKIVDVSDQEIYKNDLGGTLRFEVIEKRSYASELPALGETLVIGENNGWEHGWCGGIATDEKDCPTPPKSCEYNNPVDSGCINAASEQYEQYTECIEFGGAISNVINNNGEGMEWVGIKAIFNNNDRLTDIQFRAGGDNYPLNDSITLEVKELSSRDVDYGDYCAIPPRVENIQVNDRPSGEVSISQNGVANLTFNSVVDSQQLPLVMYAVDWGDGDQTVISGAEMRDRPDPNERKHSLYHLYSYWKIINKGNNPNNIVPRVKIKDNWGWCNGPDNNAAQLDGRRDCGHWVEYPGVIRVKK